MKNLQTKPSAWAKPVMIEAGRDLQTIVDNEEESQNQANKVIDLLRA